MNGRVGAEEELEILRLLRAGHTAWSTAHVVGRSPSTVGRIRDEHGIDHQPAVGRPAKRRVQPESTVLHEEPELDDDAGEMAVDFEVDRPNQRRWLDLVDAAGAEELMRLRAAALRVLELTRYATDETIRMAFICDRRSADQLAALYLAEAGR